ncbi:hypothetical protein JXR93_11265 [bacterium]|nr:hypothetical protein [bacterium]
MNIADIKSRVLDVWLKKDPIERDIEFSILELKESGFFILFTLFPLSYLISWVIIGNNGFHFPFLSWIKLSLLMINTLVILFYIFYKMLQFFTPSIGYCGEQTELYGITRAAMLIYIPIGAVIFLIPSFESWWLQPLISSAISGYYFFDKVVKGSVSVEEHYKIHFATIIGVTLLILGLSMNYLLFKTY